ncbi:MAG TPA: hypothetical protein VER96_26930 [Polyangiaceae bacterium]|nr:hypothetical protein [Polyangiaceae bacterium]
MTNHLELDCWDQLSSAERLGIARQLVRELPDGFSFDSVCEYRLDKTVHEIASYRYGEASFALVPGGSVELGFDSATWTPTADESASWSDTAEEYGLSGLIGAHVASATLRPRVVRVPPLLVERLAMELGWRSIAPGDPRVKKAAKSLGDAGSIQVHEGDSCVRVQRQEDGALLAHEMLRLTHADILKDMLSSGGFRLPTSDEWEHLCGGGARTLFRWGDHAPSDCYPIDESDWDLHRRPNAFGLEIAMDPYKYELTSEPSISRGGDGGSMICGGAGFFVGWLTLATAYFEPDVLRREPLATVDVGYTIARRVLPLR